jgi:hypothetical protein
MHTACCTSQLPAADVHEDEMRVAWGRLPFAARRADSAAALAAIRSLTFGCFASPVGWYRCCLGYSDDSRSTNAVFILHIFAATGEDGREIAQCMCGGLSCLEKGVADSSGGRRASAQTAREITSDAVIREDQ